jgi:hypothetical protein
MRAISSAQLGTSRDQTDHLTGRDDAAVDIAPREGSGAACAADQRTDVVELAAARLAFGRGDRFGHRIAEHARGVVQAAQDKSRVALAGIHQRLLDVVVNRRFLCRAEARTHVHAFGAERQCRRHAATVADAARSDHRHVERLHRERDQHQTGHVVFPGVTGAFESVDADDVDAVALRRQRMTHRDAFVDQHHATRLRLVDEGLRIVAGGFEDADAGIENDVEVGLVGRRLDRRQYRQIHAERCIGHAAAAFDLLRQRLGRGLGERRQDAQTAGVRHRRRQFRRADPHHSALHDGVADAQHVGDACLHDSSS